MTKADRNRRKRLERASIEQVACAVIREAGGSCANCRHFGKMPGSKKRDMCELDSDFEGYARTTADAVCSRWAGMGETG